MVGKIALWGYKSVFFLSALSSKMQDVRINIWKLTLQNDFCQLIICCHHYNFWENLALSHHRPFSCFTILPSNIQNYCFR